MPAPAPRTRAKVQSTPKTASKKARAPQKSPRPKALSKQAAGKQAVAKQAVTKKAVANKAVAKQATSKQATSKQAVAKQATSKRTVAKQAVAKQAVAKQAVAKQTVAKQAVAKQTVAKQTVAKQTVAKQAVAKRTVAKQAVAKQATSKRAERAANGATSSVPKQPAAESVTNAAKPKQAKPGASPLGAGDQAPGFELSDQSGELVSSAGLAGKPYVLYFYPKDNTPGCTLESCSFRDLHPNFKKLGVRVFGVSADSSKSHAGFAKKYELPFTLLADPERRLIEAYGSWVLKKNYGKEYMGIERSTFLVDAGGRIALAWRAVRVKGHAEAVLESARKLG